MSFLDGLRHRARVLAGRAKYEQAIEDEMRFHLSLDTAQQRDPDVARRRFGNLTYLKEETRHMSGLASFDGLTQDARQMVRSLRRTPGFAAIAILTLALGIGITTAVMSIVDHVMLNSLPLRAADRIVGVFESDGPSLVNGNVRTPSAPTVADWRQDPGVRQAFDGIEFARGEGVTLDIAGETQRIAIAYVGPQFFRLLGATPLLGRMLVDDDHRDGAPPAAVIQYAFWQRKLGGDPGIIGRKVLIDSVPTTVVGVMPPGVAFPNFAFAWLSLSQYKDKAVLTRRGVHVDSWTIGRLRPGVDSARAITLMKTVTNQLASAYPVEQANWTPVLLPLRDQVIGNVKPLLLTFAGAAAAVLLLACANVANLLLARVASRSRELAVRSALGASRGRVIRQLLTESLVLALSGGVIGTIVAAVAVRMARTSTALPRAEELSVDHRVLLVAAAACVLTALLCGIWPALRATRGNSGATLRAGSLGSVGVRGESRVRRALVTVQFALALTLLVGAGLLLQSFRRAAAVDVGFKPDGLLTVALNPPRSYEKATDAAALYERLMEVTRAVPGVSSVSFINHVPFSGAAAPTPVEIDGRSAGDTASHQVWYRTVSAGYLDTMKMRMASGRWFTDEDIRSPGGGFVINASMAKMYWPGENAIGKRLTLRRSSQARADFGQPLPGVVIGVVNDVHQVSQDAKPDPEVYVPYTLETWPWGHLVFRTRDATHAIAPLTAAIRAVDPRLIEPGANGAGRFSNFDESIRAALQPRKVSMSFIAGFAACALILAAIGMYGVVAYGVTQRTRELGVRKALGATDGMIAQLVIRESLILTAVGIVLGSLGAWFGARLIKNLLFNTEATDLTVYLPTVILLVGIALVATYIPARRATRLDPTIAMRGE